jgi:galactoside O-acetyltransferase
LNQYKLSRVGQLNDQRGETVIRSRNEYRKFKRQSTFLSQSAIQKLSLASVGKNVSIARNATIIGFENISIGNNVRIDSNVVIIATTGFLRIGNYVHIGANSYLACSHGIEFLDFSGISSGVNIFSASDDFFGEKLTNPLIPMEFRGITAGKVTLREHVIVGSQSVILPGVEIGPSSSVGALSLVNKSLASFGIYFGSPARKIGERSTNHLLLAEILKKQT